ncbi:hypothetical protein [Pseudomonas sp. NUPR-001]|uniref:hypothetical protein n=1 Tax=Pseudomonas sp. NUPR-001 TaxID=3416058 RepID=UPI003F991569
MRLMICLAGLLLAVPLQRNLDSSFSARASQEKLLPISRKDEQQPPLLPTTAAEKQTFHTKRATICGSKGEKREIQADGLIN